MKWNSNCEANPITPTLALDLTRALKAKWARFQHLLEAVKQSRDSRSGRFSKSMLHCGYKSKSPLFAVMYLVDKWLTLEGLNQNPRGFIINSSFLVSWCPRYKAPCNFPRFVKYVLLHLWLKNNSPCGSIHLAGFKLQHSPGNQSSSFCAEPADGSTNFITAQ